MSVLSQKASLSQNYTNHRLRTTSVHILDAAQIPTRHIMSVTGHKAETSLKTYTGHTNNKKKHIITKPTGAVSDFNNFSEQAERAHKDIPDFTLEPVTNSQYDDLMDDLNSDPEFDKILAEMLPNSGENIIPVASASSAVARSYTAAQSPMYFRAIISGMLSFKHFLNQLLLTKMHKLNYNIIQLLVFKETTIRINWSAQGDIDQCKAEASITFLTPINLDIGLFKHQ